MQIGQVIRKYRKSKKMTQEELASRLGLTAPAVNKWENGYSLPDITLLAPIARLLGITLDTLLSYQEELTTEEIDHFIEEADNRLKKGTYEEAFQWAKKILEEYPNCERLILHMAQIFDVQRCIKKVSEPEQYDSYLCDCYAHVLGSGDEDIKYAAADCLFGFYLRKGQYEKAEEYLAYFSKRDPERKRKQAVIYSETNRVREAYQLHEELLLSGYQMLNLILNQIFELAMKDNDMEKAELLMDKQKQLADLFEMGEFCGISCRLEMAAARKDVDMTMETMERMLASVDGICDFCQSPLYEHMEYRQPREEFWAGVKRDLREQFRDKETFGYLNGQQEKLLV